MKINVSLILLLAVIILGAGALATHEPTFQDRDSIDHPPSAQHWLGTDDFGRDLWSRFILGARWSLSIGIAASALALILGWTLGSLSGYAGGFLDQFLMRATELFLVVPWLYLLIAVRALLPLDAPVRFPLLALVLIIALVSWARPARLVRGLVISLKSRAYVDAALALGVSPATVFFRHILPDTYSLLLTQALLLVPRFILAEVTLAFLGLGAGDPEPSWGALILPLKQIYLLSTHWWKALPVLFMLPVFVLFSLSARQVDRQIKIE
jgi:peptide/nickel transport system permease protein